MPTSQCSNVHRLINVADAGAVATTASMLRQGQVVALPTDTVYGYAAAIDCADAIERIYSLKSRSIDKAIPVLLSDMDQGARVAQAMSNAALALAQAFWPGALTLVLEARDGLHPHLTIAHGNTRTVAVRVPDYAFTRDVIAALGGALAVTSANRSGEAPALNAAEIDHAAAYAPDAIADGGQVKGGVASTIVRFSGQDLEILREGAIPMAELAAILKNHGLH